MSDINIQINPSQAYNPFQGLYGRNRGQDNTQRTTGVAIEIDFNNNQQALNTEELSNQTYDSKGENVGSQQCGCQISIFI